jgi:hypothetical protein
MWVWKGSGDGWCDSMLMWLWLFIGVIWVRACDV